MDINVNTKLKQSEINGLFQEMEQLKNKRKQLKELIDQKQETIINHILKNGNVLAYKDNVPHILTVKDVTLKKFDKATLADDVGRTQAELNAVGIAEIVEENKISSEELRDYFYEEPKQTLKARKAKKSDIELIRGVGL